MSVQLGNGIQNQLGDGIQNQLGVESYEDSKTPEDSMPTIAGLAIYVLGMTEMVDLHFNEHTFYQIQATAGLVGFREFLSFETGHLAGNSKKTETSHEIGANWLQEISGIENADGELVAEFAGRVCYMAFGKNQHSIGNRDYIRNILKQGHGSVLEHGSVNLLFTGISRTLSHELVRHRAGWAYSQLSQRYVDSSDVKFVMPVDIESAPQLIQDNWHKLCKNALETYEELVNTLAENYTEEEKKKLKVKERRMACRQAARSVLPGCTETKVVATANFRALRHFCELRGTKFAEPEIRRLAIRLTLVLKNILPSVFQDFEIEDDDGVEVVTCQYHKV